MNKFWIIYFLLFILGCNTKENTKAAKVSDGIDGNKEVLNTDLRADIISFHISTSKNDDWCIMESMIDSTLDIKFVENDMIYKGDTLDFIEELGFDFLETFTFDPSYGIFLCRVDKITQEHVYFFINNQKYRIKRYWDDHFELLTFEDYILDAYATLMNDTLYLRPTKSAKIIKVDSIEDRIFEAEKVKGNWVKLVESSECFIGGPPSEPITGWVIWRREGSSELLLDFGLLC